MVWGCFGKTVISLSFIKCYIPTERLYCPQCSVNNDVFNCIASFKAVCKDIITPFASHSSPYTHVPRNITTVGSDVTGTDEWTIKWGLYFSQNDYRFSVVIPKCLFLADVMAPLPTSPRVRFHLLSGHFKYQGSIPEPLLSFWKSYRPHHC